LPYGFFGLLLSMGRLKTQGRRRVPMGKKDRERVERTGMVFRDGKLVSVKEAMSDRDRERIHYTGKAVLQASSTSSQVKVLAESLRTGRLSPSKLRKALKDNAPKEMRKGADKLIKKGKSLTVDSLLEEYRKDKEFQNLASEVDLDENWFIELAKAEIKRRGDTLK